MRVSWVKRWTSAVIVAALVTTSALAGQAVVEEGGKRKVKSRVNPSYSDLARRMNLTGKVKIEVVIAPDGRVRNARAIGGHPLLVQSCLDAVRDWRYEPAPEESTQIVEFEFKP